MPTRGSININPTEVYIEWKIQYFFFTTKEDDAEGSSSQSFYFGGEPWSLGMSRMEDRALQKNEDRAVFALYLVRHKYEPSLNLKFNLGIITASGTKERQSRHIHNFNRSWYKCGVQRFISKSELLERRHELVPDDTLTVFCLLSYPSYNKDESWSSSSPHLFHEFKVLRDYKELFHKKEDCDVVIHVKGQEFLAHSAILRARSPVFASTYRYDTRERATGVIDIDDCEPSAFSAFLCFLYCADVGVISVENVFNLFTTADKYHVDDLRVKCIDFMKQNVSVDTFCETMNLALQHSETELAAIADDFFTKRALEIAQTAEWRTFATRHPKKSNDLFIKALASKDPKLNSL